jgi:magnesium-transporting ATPase (P-type)
VEEGRRIFDNITKFIVWTLPTNLGEGLLILVALAAGVTLPILPVQILWINMTTAVALGLMLAFEAQEPGTMSRPPREPGQPVLTRELVGRIVLVSSLLLAGSFWLFEWELARGAPIAEARTVAVNVFVVVEMFYLLNCRSLERSLFHVGPFSNPWVLVGIGVTIALQLAFTYIPQMQILFDSASIEPEAWLRIVALGLLAWAVVGGEKWLRRRRARSRPISPRLAER